MKPFEQPEYEVIRFEEEDVITTSGCSQEFTEEDDSGF